MNSKIYAMLQPDLQQSLRKHPDEEEGAALAWALAWYRHKSGFCCLDYEEYSGSRPPEKTGAFGRLLARPIDVREVDRNSFELAAWDRIFAIWNKMSLYDQAFFEGSDRRRRVRSWLVIVVNKQDMVRLQWDDDRILFGASVGVMQQ